MPESSSWLSPASAAPDPPSAFAVGLPTRTWVAGTMHRPRMTMPTVAAMTLCRTIRRAHAVHPRLALSSRRMRGQSTFLANVARNTGSRVIATSTLISGISMPAYPTLRRNGTGITTIASRPIATVTPENTTARPAVVMVRSTAVCGSYPAAHSSRQRVTISKA